MSFYPAFGASFPRPFGGVSNKIRYTLTSQPDGVNGTDIDTYLSAAAPDTNYGTYSAVVISTVRNFILKFDLSSIPLSASLVSATLSLCLTTVPSANRTCYIYRILAANSGWIVSEATWNHKAGTTDWAGGHNGCGVLGTDCASDLMATFIEYSTDPQYTIYNIPLTLSEVSLMIASNSGIMITGSTSSSGYSASSNSTTASYRPKLVIVYDA